MQAARRIHAKLSWRGYWQEHPLRWLRRVQGLETVLPTN